MAAIRSKLEVALERSRFPESNWRLVGISAAYLLTAPTQQLGEIPAPPPPNEAGGCWKELPESLAKKKAVWNPRNADHRCFMWCVLAHCLGVDKLTKEQRWKAATCSGSFFYPEQARRPGRRPAGRQPALADAGLDFSGLPTDRPVGFEDIDAFERRNSGRVEVFVFAWQRTQWQDGQEYFHILQQRAPANQGSAEHTALLLLHQGHFALIHNFQALASRRGVALGATPSNSGGCKEYKCPKCMARFTKKASWQRRRSSRCYREVAERTRKVPLPDPEKRQHLLRYKPKASAELAPLVCYADLEVYSTPAPSVHVAQAQPARQTTVASSCYVAVGRCGEPPEELRLRLARHERGSGKFHVVRTMLDDLLKLAAHYLQWRQRCLPARFTLEEELAHERARHCRECLRSFAAVAKKLHHCHGTGRYLGALCHSCNIAAQTPKSVPVVFHNGGGYDFHFLLRYIASRGSPVRRVRQDEEESSGSDSDSDSSDSDSSSEDAAQPKAKAKAKAKARALGGWHAAQAALQQGDYSHLRLSVLSKSGEKCLQLCWGPLRFVDSMNVFPTSLANMIDDLRACAAGHRSLPELFPLMASHHPELRKLCAPLRPTIPCGPESLRRRCPQTVPLPPAPRCRAVGRRRGPTSRRIRCCRSRLALVWDCLLRKLPMPFGHFSGPEAWQTGGVGARLLQQRAGRQPWARRSTSRRLTPLGPWGGRTSRSSTTATSTQTSWPWRTSWRATGTPSGRSRGSTRSITSRCRGPPGTPC